MLSLAAIFGLDKGFLWILCYYDLCIEVDHCSKSRIEQHNLANFWWTEDLKQLDVHHNSRILESFF